MSKEAELLSNADASVNQNSVPYQKSDLKDYSIQATFSSATINGSLQLQASNDNVNWHDVTGGTQAIVNGETHLFNVTGGNYKFTRVAWTATSGTGTLTLMIFLIEPLLRS